MKYLFYLVSFSFYVLVLFPSCISNSYEVSDLNGVYVIRNYNTDGGIIGPEALDTLVLCDGLIINKYYGNGSYHTEKDRYYNCVSFDYLLNLEGKSEKTSRRFYIKNPITGDLRLIINSDLNYYYERINKECE